LRSPAAEAALVAACVLRFARLIRAIPTTGPTVSTVAMGTTHQFTSTEASGGASAGSTSVCRNDWAAVGVSTSRAQVRAVAAVTAAVAHHTDTPERQANRDRSRARATEVPTGSATASAAAARVRASGARCRQPSATGAASATSMSSTAIPLSAGCPHAENTTLTIEAKAQSTPARRVLHNGGRAVGEELLLTCAP